MHVTRFFLFLLATLLTLGAGAQKIVYSEADRDDSRRTTFEVIGKVGGNFLVYKNNRNRSTVTVFDNDMKQIAKEPQAYLPEDRLLNIDFFPYTDFSWVIYEYQKKNVVYCAAVKIDGMGKAQGEPLSLDTTHIGFNGSNKIYSVVSSDDKNQLMVFKINSRNKSRYVLTTMLLNKALALQKRSTMTIDMTERDDHLGQFRLDNDGDLVFVRYTRVNNDNLSKAALLYKAAAADTLEVVNVELGTNFLDEIHIKTDNPNKRIFLTSFYYKQRRGNIEGFFFYVWDKVSRTVRLQNALPLGEELRREARGDAGTKNAFNDYFIRNIVVKKDGGFIIGSEAYYTTSRLNNWNRWDYLYGSPYNSMYDYYSYSPYSSWYWRNRFNSNQAVRYHADNITILSFDPTGKLQWSNVVHKSQFNDESDDGLSYQVMNTGGALHFLFNMDEKRVNLLNDYVLQPDGAMARNPTLKNLDRNYDFLPRYGKQVSARQMIVPCYYRNNICFAKIEYNG
ncbi:hypothetical protein [Flaviaesturariibacter amylovorans]|uniref:6-bladed beta-propeller n=1 Tax=Flaviaesturariibacter amylovorans TaxID=1084520 RepID=A0ABP8HD52_9BACT